MLSCSGRTTEYDEEEEEELDGDSDDAKLEAEGEPGKACDAEADLEGVCSSAEDSGKARGDCNSAAEVEDEAEAFGATTERGGPKKRWCRDAR